MPSIRPWLLTFYVSRKQVLVSKQQTELTLAPASREIDEMIFVKVDNATQTWISCRIICPWEELAGSNSDLWNQHLVF